MQPDSITRGCCCCIAIERAPQFWTEIGWSLCETHYQFNRGSLWVSVFPYSSWWSAASIKSNPGEIIKPGVTCKFILWISFLAPHSWSLDILLNSGQYKAINDEGMPHYIRPFMKGKPYIRFNVEFADSGSLSPLSSAKRQLCMMSIWRRRKGSTSSRRHMMRMKNHPRPECSVPTLSHLLLFLCQAEFCNDGLASIYNL